MAISDNYAPDKTSGNGVTVAFSGNWNTIAAAYFRLYWEDKTTLVQTLKTLGTHYTLSFTASGYTATHDALYIPPSTVNVIRARSIDLTQTDPYKTSTGFQGLTVENSFDKLTAISQDLQDQIDRCVKFPLGNQATITNPTYGDLPVDGYGIVWDGATGLMRNTDASLAVLEGNAAIVAASIASVNTVAGSITSVNTVATNIASVNTVASAIANVNLVGGSIASVNTVAGISANVTTVAGISANVTTVAGISANVTTVAGISGNVTTVAGLSTQITGVYNIRADVTAVYGIAANVTTVAGISASVTTVAGIQANVTTVAGVATSISTLAPISANITTVAGISANVTTVAGVSASITTLAPISANITTVAGISANVTTVAGISANVTTVATNATAVTTVATNITDVVSAAAAINSAMKFTFATSTVMADPTTGLLRFNNATPASVTAIAIDDLSAQTGNPDLSAYIPTWDDATGSNKGTLIITKGSAPATFVIFTITGLTDNAGWTQLAVTYVTGNGTFSASDSLYLSFVRNGDTGATGAAGSIPLVDAGGTVDAITANYTPDITLSDYQIAGFISTGANTSTTPSFAPDGLTARTITKNGGQALAAGDIGAAGSFHIIEYDLTNTRWELLNPAKVDSVDFTPAAFSGLTALTAVDTADVLPLKDVSAGTNKSATVNEIFKGVNTFTALTAVDTADNVNIYDTSASASVKATVNELFKAVNTFTAMTDVDTADNVNVYDTSGSASKKATLAELFEVINTFTADGSPDVTADYALTYDASAATVKKVLLNLIGAAAGLTTIASGTLSTGSPTVVDVTSIGTGYRALVAFASDASNSVATRALRITPNCGAGLGSESAGYTQIANTTVTVINPASGKLWTDVTQTAAQVTSAIIVFPYYQSGPIKHYYGMIQTAETAGAGWGTAASRTWVMGTINTGNVAITAAVQGIRFTWDNVATGVFDGTGTYAVYGVN